MRHRAFGVLALAALSGCDTRNGGFVGLPVSTSVSLSSIQLTSGALSPTFATATTNYTVAVPNATTQLAVRPTAAGAGTTITVSGRAVRSGEESAPLSLSAGANNVPVVVSSPSGASRTYTLAVNRANPLP